MGKYKIRRRHKTIKTKYIFFAIVVGLMLITIGYARHITQLRINGTATSIQEQFDVTYLFFSNTTPYPNKIGYMSTYTYTFTGSPVIESIIMGDRTLTINTDYTYSNGTLTIPNVTGNLVISGEEPEYEDFTIRYVYGDNLYFNGASLMNTGIALFTAANFERDFDITIDIDSSTYNSGQTGNYNTVINAVNHNTSPYHGFLIRRNASSYFLKCTTGPTNVAETQVALNDVHNIRISRTSKILYGDLNTGSNLTQIGDYTNYNVKFNWPVFIGADSDNNNPAFRFFKGEMSNVTIKLYYEAEEAPVTLPTPTWTGYTFGGWYSDSNLTNKIGDGGASFSPSGNTSLYAKWVSNESIPKVAEVNGIQYETLQEAVTRVPANNTETIVTLLKDTAETITVKSGQNVKFDLQNYTLRDNGTDKVIDNKGTITITNGTLKSSGATIIDNQSGGVLKLLGGRLEATGSKQAVYNYGGGTVEISGDVYITSKASGTPTGSGALPRATVHNLANGTITITGGTIIGQVQNAISNAGNLTIGTKDGNISTTAPIIQGETDCIKNSTTIKIYDGILKGITGIVSGTITEIETNSQWVNDTETINNKTYMTQYLEQSQ